MVLVDRWIPELGDRAPRVVILENVEEFAEWGPLDNKGRIIEAAKGERFRTFVRKLRSCGYRVDWRELRACDYGAPTIRKRLFMIARRDNQAIVWPEPTHGAPDSPGSSRRDAEAVADRRRVHRLVPPVPVDFRLVRGNHGAVWHPGCAAFGGKHAQAHSERRCPLCPEQPDTVHRDEYQRPFPYRHCRTAGNANDGQSPRSGAAVPCPPQPHGGLLCVFQGAGHGYSHVHDNHIIWCQPDPAVPRQTLRRRCRPARRRARRDGDHH